MSEMLATADLIKARLDAWKAQESDPAPALAGVNVFVDRQKDVAAIVLKLVGVAGGNAVSIFFEGFRVPNPEAGGLRIIARYAIGTWSHPVINSPGGSESPKAADDIVRNVCKALHQWVPTGLHNFGEVKITGADLVPDRAWLRYEINAEIHMNL